MTFKQFLIETFTWWNGQTLGTRFHLWLEQRWGQQTGEAADRTDGARDDAGPVGRRGRADESLHDTAGHAQASGDAEQRRGGPDGEWDLEGQDETEGGRRGEAGT